MIHVSTVGVKDALWSLQQSIVIVSGSFSRLPVSALFLIEVVLMDSLELACHDL